MGKKNNSVSNMDSSSYDSGDVVTKNAKALDAVCDGLDQRLGSVAARHLDPKKVKIDHALEAYAIHIHNIPPAVVNRMSHDDIVAHANDFFADAAKAHPTLAHVQTTPTSRQLKKKYGLDWG